MLKKISKYWWCQILGWSAYFLINLFFAYTWDKLTESYYINLFLLIACGVFSTHFFRIVIHRLNWFLYSFEKQLLLFLGVNVGSGILMYMSYLGMLAIAEHSRTQTFKETLGGLLSFMMLTTFWWLIYFIWHYIERNRKSQVDRLKLETTVKELELKTIKSQMNPHFIFNALNSIRALVDENPQRARTAITELSNILRSSMQTEKSETVSLENELNIVKDYLALEHIRFEERLKVKYDIDPDTLELQVPPMMLQTLVENAIKHGISREVSGGTVYIGSHVKGEAHEITIENTGQLMERGIDGHGFGLQSTRQRLSLLYGSRASLEINNKNGKTVEARVLMPLI